MPLLLDDEVLPVARLARLSVALTFFERHYPSQLFSCFLLRRPDGGTTCFYNEAVRWKATGD